MKRLSIFLVAGSLAACGGGEPASDAPAAAPAATAPAPAPAAFNAEATFNTVCAACHGAGGLGDGPAGAALNPPPASFADEEFWATRDDERLFTVIKEGAAAVGGSALMVGWGASFDDDQIRQLVEHVKSFRPTG